MGKLRKMFDEDRRLKSTGKNECGEPLLVVVRSGNPGKKKDWDRVALLDNGDMKEELENGNRAEELENGYRVEELENVDRAEELENGDRAEELENGDRAEELENGDRAEELENGDRAEELENGDRAEELENGDRVDELEKGDSAEELENDGMENDYSSDEEELASYSEQKSIIKFLNSANISDLCRVKGCSLVKAKKLCHLRPFDSWNDLMDKISQAKHLTIELALECLNVLKQREKMEELIKKSECISKSIEGLFEMKRCNQENNGSDSTSSMLVVKEKYAVSEPSLVASGFKLKSYQLTGLNWLIALHKRDVNGILADEMGLGKTIQAIVFLAYLIEQNEGPHLIVVPSSTLDNWKRELERWCPSITCLLYYGSQAERRAFRDKVLYSERKFQILLTTYNMGVSSTFDSNFLRKLKFHYAVFDEAHMLKNMDWSCGHVFRVK
ncbi:SWI/SNF-related matrix-associated actin-dependent regulator of chromatin subfamily A containing DEAD/H box 1-like [Xenia sp. Carnegie-2017]|uniref:SWI/SNF-related matrix-associated actin-dependent regulator of chromatin subfamily A containing DEAD/H box 1-like n=1 Tax=Xenia sp. Carnegie-2017 TaxID=2897299 RepID=UPI001F032FD9|nr:SWI/SNF-related matrix-associated actin-dependent regulator of chromatin subfamily A containing DEAD/H box 1-like [Xenia sp. Carnegie-2017]